MQKKVLTEVDLYYGEIKTPKGFEIDRNAIKHSIVKSWITAKRKSNNEQAYAYRDYEVEFSQPLQWFQDYIRDHYNCEFHKNLIPRNIFGNVYKENESSPTRNHLEAVDLRNSPDYTLIYSVDVEEGSSEVVIEYDDNRRAGRTWHVPLKNNHFIMFPASQKYMISPNTSNKTNIILTITYEYI